MLDELFAERTLAEWEEVLSRQQGQWDVFLKAGRVRYDEQVQANEYAQLVEHDGDGKVVLVPGAGAVRRRGDHSSAGGRRSAPTPTRCSPNWVSTQRRSPTCGPGGSSAESS